MSRKLVGARASSHASATYAAVGTLRDDTPLRSRCVAPASEQVRQTPDLDNFSAEAAQLASGRRSFRWPAFSFHRRLCTMAPAGRKPPSGGAGPNARNRHARGTMERRRAFWLLVKLVNLLRQPSGPTERKEIAKMH